MQTLCLIAHKFAFLDTVLACLFILIRYVSQSHKDVVFILSYLSFNFHKITDNENLSSCHESNLIFVFRLQYNFKNLTLFQHGYQHYIVTAPPSSSMYLNLANGKSCTSLNDKWLRSPFCLVNP